MQEPILRVFVSSTWTDLQPERKALEQALARLRETKFIGMEYFGSRNETTREVSVLEVNRTDLFVAVIAGRYGSGITAAEYRRALCAAHSGRCVAAYLYSAAGPGESTTDVAWDGHATIRHVRAV